MTQTSVMVQRYTQSLMALLMAVPMCWCCLAQVLPVQADDKDCSSCHKFLLPEDRPQKQSAPSSDCPCCVGTLERALSPDIAAAPSLVLVDLQTPVWQPVEGRLQPTRRQLVIGQKSTASDLVRRMAVPFYQQHCSLLL